MHSGSLFGAGEKAESWAKSEKRGPFVARYLFLKGLSGCTISENDRWQKQWARADDPVPAAIQRMLDKGIDPADLTDVVRAMQVETLFNVCQLLDSASHGLEDEQAQIPENVEWRLAEYDGEKEVLGREMPDLHESFHSMDPTGREGEPRDRFPKPKKPPKKRPGK